MLLINIVSEQARWYLLPFIVDKESLHKRGGLLDCSEVPLNQIEQKEDKFRKITTRQTVKLFNGTAANLLLGVEQRNK